MVSDCITTLVRIVRLAVERWRKVFWFVINGQRWNLSTYAPREAYACFYKATQLFAWLKFRKVKHCCTQSVAYFLKHKQDIRCTHTHSIIHTPYVYIHMYMQLHLHLYQSMSKSMFIPLFMSIFESASASMSMSMSMSLPMSQPMPMSLSLSLSLSISIPMSMSMSMSISICPCLSQYLRLRLRPSLGLRAPLCLLASASRSRSSYLRIHHLCYRHLVELIRYITRKSSNFDLQVALAIFC